MSDARRRVTLLLGVVALLVLLLAAAPAAHGQEGTVEVRVAAQRLLGGNTEFALQERQANGEWAERRLPARRIFPASVAAGRWLSSSELTIEAQPDGMTAATPEAGLEVRVAAQLLADGRMEFALQERGADGTWEERRLPARRFFPANATVGRWLSSSSLTVEVPSDSMLAATPAPADTCLLADNVDRVTAATFEVQTATGTGTAFYIGDGEWITNHHVVDTVSSASLVHGDTRLTATVAGSLPGYDLALLSAQPPTGGTGALGFASARPLLASSVSVVGFPFGVSSTPSLTSGVVSKHAPFSEFTFLDGEGVVLQTDAEINPGNSGGPIVDDCGNVAGVATFKFFTASDGRDLDGIGFGIAVETVAVQLTSLRSATHYARRVPSAAAPVATALEITALCSGNWDSSDDCQAAAASGLDTSDPGIWARGVEEWDNLYYSIDELEGRDYLSLRDLGRGRHTLQINERRAGGWTGWSAPYTFTITGAAPMEIRAICNGDWADYSTSDDCFAAGSGGILAEDSPVDWTLGVSEWGNVRYSIDGGTAVSWEDLSLRSLAAGFHTIQASEQQAAGWTGWSEPYAFTILGAAPLEILAYCDGPAGGHATSEECHASPATRGGRHWLWPRGVQDWDNLRVSVDGGAAVAWADLNLWSLLLGRHNIRIGEQQAAGWTGWSDPYTFTIVTDSSASASLPATPTGLRLTKIDIPLWPDHIRVNWNAVSGATWYEVHHHAAGTQFDHEASVTSTFYLDQYPNILYYDSYIVRACNSSGCSAFSARVTER